MNRKTTNTGCPFSGWCDECGREVRRVLPPDTEFIQTKYVRLFCRDCHHPTRCSKEG